MKLPRDDGPNPRLRAAMACVERDCRVLLQQRLRDGKRCVEFPGGRLEEGESFSQAARRELLEEVGLELSGPCHDERVITTARGDEIAFCRLSCPPELEPRMVDPRREQVFFWLPWTEIPWREFPLADRAFIALRWRQVTKDRTRKLPDELVEALVLAAVGEADPDEILFWIRPAHAEWGNERLFARLDKGVDGASGHRAGNWARLRRIARQAFGTS